MRKIFALLLLLIPLTISCEEKNDFNGAWALLETYNSWKVNGDEDIAVTEVKIGNTTFLELTNSIVIRSQDQIKIFSVPGGKWKILDIKKIDNDSYTMELESLRKEGEVGSVTLILVSESEIYFSKGKMSEGFLSEMNQSFLMFGKDMLYKQCDKVSQ